MEAEKGEMKRSDEKKSIVNYMVDARASDSIHNLHKMSQLYAISHLVCRMCSKTTAAAI